MPAEKTHMHLDTAEIDEELEALEGYVVDPSRYSDNASRLETSGHGRYVLIRSPAVGHV